MSPPYRRRCGNAGQQAESYFRAPQDTPATLTLRAAVRARKDLVAHRVAACNQLRAHLAVAFPAAIGLFFDLDSPISLAFLTRFGSQDAAAPLDEQALAARDQGQRATSRRHSRARARPVTAALPAALRASAAGLYPAEPGTELLLSHGGFLDRHDFAGFIHASTSISDGITPMAWIDWDAAVTTRQPPPGGERRILQLAASIAGGTPVSLRDAIPGLDDRNLQLVITAILHTAGQRPRAADPTRTRTQAPSATPAGPTQSASIRRK